MENFEQYMQGQCPDSGTGGSDGAQEAYERWVSNLDAQEVWDYAESYGLYAFQKGIEMQAKIMRDTTDALNKAFKL